MYAERMFRDADPATKTKKYIFLYIFRTDTFIDDLRQRQDWFPKKGVWGNITALVEAPCLITALLHGRWKYLDTCTATAPCHTMLLRECMGCNRATMPFIAHAHELRTNATRTSGVEGIPT